MVKHHTFGGFRTDLPPHWVRPTLVVEVEYRQRLGLYWTIAGTGMRLGEALGLRDTDLELDAGVLSIRQTLKQSGKVGKPKTERSRRMVTLPVEVVDALREVRKWKIEQKLRRGPKFRDCGLVFCTPRGRPLHQNNIRIRDFYPRLLRLELPKVRLTIFAMGMGPI